MDFLSKQRFEEFTEQEFIDFLNELFREDESGTDERADKLLLHFKDLAGHPLGSDLIYYPESGTDNSAEGITQTIKEWRKANGLPGFKKASILDDCTIDTWAIPESAPGKIHLIITDHFKWGNENEAQHLKLLQEKINTYLAFIKSGELTSAIPSSEGKTPVIFVEGKYPLSEQALKFFSAVDQALNGTGIEVAFESR